MPLQATSGAASYDAFGGGVPAVTNYIEDVFSTWLYTGDSSTQTITNGVDLSTKGGMVWIKARQQTDGSTSPLAEHGIWDTARGVGTSGSVSKAIQSNSNLAQNLGWTDADYISAFNTTGFTVQNAGGNTEHRIANHLYQNYASWTFRKQPKFFDIVTYTGDGTGGSRQLAHNLGSTPGCVLIKRTDASGNWMGFHRGTGATNSAIAELSLNLTTAPVSGAAFSQSLVTSTYFVAGDIQSADGGVSANTNGATYVAYLFAHNAGGFGLTGTDNVISCGSYTGNGSATGPVVTLDYEPQWLMIKKSSSTGNWQMLDNLRGMPVGSADAALRANLATAEASVEYVSPTATGFQITSSNTEVNTNAATYIYIAIRRGPMKVPTSGTSVFGLNARTGTGANATVTGNAGVTDLAIVKNKGSTPVWLWSSRLTNTGYLSSNASTSETAAGTTILQAIPWDVMDGVKVGTTSTITNASSNTFINYLFKRAPSFFDVVCYTGNGTAGATQTHNLGVVPEMMIVKARNYSGGRPWPVYHSGMGNTKFMYLNSTDAEATNPWWNDTTPTASVFTIGSNSVVNFSGTNYVAYLFATCAGVSKVGTYTGTDALQTINCGFTSSARFILIKRTNAIGDWWLYDSARGITSGNDPYILINTTAAEVTGYNYVATDSTGFQVTAAAADINTSGDTYIFLAIA